MTAQRHDPVGRDTVENGLARLDRLRGIIIEDWRPLRVLQACHGIVRNITHVDELLIA